MVRIDDALEKRVWQRVYGKAQPARQSRELAQLYATARDCALLFGELSRQSRGKTALDYRRMERQMTGAARQLRLACGEEARFSPPTGCPGCSRERKLELLRLWLREFSRRCRSLRGHDRHGVMLDQLARVGENLGRYLGQRR